jgi:hypothetical protein
MALLTEKKSRRRVLGAFNAVPSKKRIWAERFVAAPEAALEFLLIGW